MIYAEQYPFNDTERADFHDWLNSPARFLYQKMLYGQAAEKMAEAEMIRVENEQGAEGEANLLTDQARVLIAAAKFFDQVSSKDSSLVYFVRLNPQPPTKTNHAETS